MKKKFRGRPGFASIDQPGAGHLVECAIARRRTTRLAAAQAEIEEKRKAMAGAKKK